MTKGVDSWVTLTEANTYFATKYLASASWTALSNSIKESLLVNAFNWINQQALFSIAAIETSIKVQQAQCEAAWFIYKYGEEYDKRQALQAGGVKKFTISEFEEEYTGIIFPKFITDILKDFISSTGGGFALMTRELED